MKKRSRTEYSLINISAGLLGYVLNTLLGFICRVVFVRTLSADYLGVNGLFTNILSMLSLAELGISSAIIYALYKPIAQNDEQKIASIMQFYRKTYMVIGCIVAAVGLALLPFLDVIIQEPPKIQENISFLYLLYLFNTVISYFFSYRSSLLIAMQRQYIVTGYSYIITILQSIFQMILLLLTHNYLLYLLIQIAGGISYNIWISWKAGKDYSYIKNQAVTPLNKQEKRDLFWNIKALAVNKISGVLVNSTDNIAITFFNGLSSVGFASNYTLFSSTLDKLITLTFNGLTGSVGNLNASSDEAVRYRFFKALNLANFWMYGWVALGMAFVSGDLVRLLYGAEYVLPLKIPIIMALNLYTVGMLHAFYTYKSTLGLFKYGQYLLFFTGFINLAFDVILGLRFGVFGIYLATFVARLLTNIWYEPYAIYKYGLHKNPVLYLGRYLKYALVLVVTAVLCYGLCAMCAFAPIVNVLVKMVICSIVPNAVFILVFHRTEEFQYLYGHAKKIVGHTKRH